MRARYGVHYTDMAPLRAIRRDRLEALGMIEATYGWNLEMQMRAAASGLRIREVPVRCRRRAGGRSKVSGELARDRAGRPQPDRDLSSDRSEHARARQVMRRTRAPSPVPKCRDCGCPRSHASAPSARPAANTAKLAQRKIRNT